MFDPFDWLYAVSYCLLWLTIFIVIWSRMVLLPLACLLALMLLGWGRGGKEMAPLFEWAGPFFTSSTIEILLLGCFVFLLALICLIVLSAEDDKAGGWHTIAGKRPEQE